MSLLNSRNSSIFWFDTNYLKMLLLLIIYSSLENTQQTKSKQCSLDCADGTFTTGSQSLPAMATPNKICINGSARRSDHIVQQCTQNTAAPVSNAGIYRNGEAHYSARSFHVRSGRGAWDCQGLFSLAFILALILHLCPPYSLWEGVEFILVIAQESNENCAVYACLKNA